MGVQIAGGTVVGVSGIGIMVGSGDAIADKVDVSVDSRVGDIMGVMAGFCVGVEAIVVMGEIAVFSTVTAATCVGDGVDSEISAQAISKKLSTQKINSCFIMMPLSIEKTKVEGFHST